MGDTARCESCGARLIDGHLKNCKLKYVASNQYRDTPTQAMIEFAKDLIQDLGYCIDDYDFEQMTYEECGKLIGELKKERDG